MSMDAVMVTDGSSELFSGGIPIPASGKSVGPPRNEEGITDMRVAIYARALEWASKKFRINRFNFDPGARMGYIESVIPGESRRSEFNDEVRIRVSFDDKNEAQTTLMLGESAEPVDHPDEVFAILDRRLPVAMERVEKMRQRGFFSR